MSIDPEIAAARDEVRRSREQIADTISELEQRITAPVAAVKRRLDVGRLVQEHPWVALTVAAGAGAALSASGTDARLAAAAAEKAREGAAAAVRLAKEGGPAAVEATKRAPSRTREALVGAMDGLAAKLALSFISSLREPSKPASAAPSTEAVMPLPRPGLGIVDDLSVTV